MTYHTTLLYITVMAFLYLFLGDDDVDIRKKSQKQEKNLAKLLGGKTRPGSGSKWAAKGDVRTEKFLVEAKRTDADSIRVSAKVWNKIRKEAIREGLREPMYAIQIQDLDLTAIDVNCPLLTEKDPDYEFIGYQVEGRATAEIRKDEWAALQNQCMGLTLPIIIVLLETKDEDTGDKLEFNLLLMKTDDFLKVMNMI